MQMFRFEFIYQVAMETIVFLFLFIKSWSRRGRGETETSTAILAKIVKLSRKYGLRM